MRFLIFAVLALVGCTPQPSPVVPSPDASDASALGDSPRPAWDPSCAAAPPACASACAAMQTAGCVEPPLCPCVLASVDAHRLNVDPSITTAGADNHLTCAMLANVKTAADVKAHGWSCGP